MKPQQIQQQLKLNADVLTGLYEEHAKLKRVRKMYNEEADKFVAQHMEADAQLDFDSSHTLKEQADANRQQAAIFTPYIKKFKAKIKAVSSLQAQLKRELKCSAMLEAWVAEDDAFWLQEAKLAREDGYADFARTQAFLAEFEGEE